MIGYISGTACGTLVLLFKGTNTSGIRSAAIGFVTGGETCLGATDTMHNPDLSRQEKLNQFVQLTGFGIIAGLSTDYAIAILCPTLSIARSIFVIVGGVGMVSISGSNSVPHLARSFLGTAGRSAFIAGIALMVASTFHYLKT